MLTTEIRSLLSTLGLSANETRVYLASVELGMCGIHDIARRARIHRVAAYPIVDQLVQKGLLEMEPRRYGKRMTAVSPRRLIGMAIDGAEKMHRTAERLERVLPELLAAYARRAKPRVRYLEGKTGFLQLMDEIEETGALYDHLGGSEDELLAVVGKKQLEASVAKKDARHIRRRVLVAPGSFAKEQAKKISPFREYRFLPPSVAIPARCYLYAPDRSAFVAFVPDLLIVVIEHRDIYAVQKLFFETLWQTALPLERLPLR